MQVGVCAMSQLHWATRGTAWPPLSILTQEQRGGDEGRRGHQPLPLELSSRPAPSGSGAWAGPAPRLSHREFLLRFMGGWGVSLSQGVLSPCAARTEAGFVLFCFVFHGFKKTWKLSLQNFSNWE